MTKINDFEKCLAMGLEAEELIKSQFKQIFRPILYRVLYDPNIPENMKLQRNGVDGRISLGAFDYEIKSRDFYYYQFNDIALETLSVIEQNKPGWFYTCKSDVVVYIWWNRSKTRFVDGYLLFLDAIRKWFKGKEQYFRRCVAWTLRESVKWSTENRAVPITAFPRGCIQQITPNYFRSDEQAKLDAWFEQEREADSTKINLGEYS